MKNQIYWKINYFISGFEYFIDSLKEWLDLMFWDPSLDVYPLKKRINQLYQWLGYCNYD